MYSEGKPTRHSPGIFAILIRFTRKREAGLLAIPVPFLVGFASFILHSIKHGSYYWPLFWRDVVLFSIVMWSGVVFCVGFKNRAKIFTSPIILLVNAYFTFFFALCYEGGYFLLLFFQNPAILEVFFLLGAILSYIIAFIFYFSFTTVGRPWYLILALVQPVVGIILYSFYTAQIYVYFFLRTIIMFCISAVIFAVPYAAGMLSVSNVYRQATGVGGYNFLRAFILSLLTEDNDDLVESFFDDIGTPRNMPIEYLAFRAKGGAEPKGLMLTPHIHFGPFKTAGSSTLAEKIYDKYAQIPGITVFHTACTHAENLTRHGECDKVIAQVESDLGDLKYRPATAPKFTRTLEGTMKVLATRFDGFPLVVATRHPHPSDDIDPLVLETLERRLERHGITSLMFVDGHNAIVGDEVPVIANTPAAEELLVAAEDAIVDKLADSVEKYPVQYGVARDPMTEYSYLDGVGSGGMTVHLFKIGDQLTAIVNIDGNNAVLDLRSRLISLFEDKGVDKVELCTSDTHIVARVFSAQGYNPLGRKIPIDDLLRKAGALLDRAREDLEEVEVAHHSSVIRGVKVWGDPRYFDAVVMPTVDKCVRVSKTLLTLGLVIPFLLSAVFLAAFYEIDINWENFPYL
ncbi:MAG: DUF2070 family protein [Promethearchaeota archaeon]